MCGPLPLCRAKLIFGGGTKLTVLPKEKAEREPTLSIYYPPVGQSKQTNQAATVCLLAPFYPNKVTVNITLTETTEVKTENVLTQDGYYRTSGFREFPHAPPPKTIGCSATYDGRLIERTENISALDKPQPLICETGTSSNYTVTDIPETNFMTLTVMGLRILFVKSVVFNVLMTARAWVF
ncbi:T cell receptor delta constant [Leucoraja erinacea]|uniref:T cell receptor delta constant n=1 Tax=Leucoraja erinaceus TaxID=7782 RepID=UPI0024578AFF|nr:T cell receptor delta constant [Leucoraja erinacea]